MQPAAFGWGNEGHLAVNRAAAAKVPASMPPFLRKAADRLAYLGPEPDRWRNRSEYAVKNAQEPDHFIDLERVEGMDLPEGRYEFYRKLYEKRATAAKPDDLLPERVGLQPYITMEVFDRLKVAFREYRQMKAAHKSTAAVEQNIVFYAGWLGHYVADGAQPLHTTIHYNGWVGDNPQHFTTSRDIHSLFESGFVNRHVAELKLAELLKAPTRLDHPFKDYLAYLRESQSQVVRLYELEKTGAFKDAGTPAGLEFVRHALGRGTQMLLNLWYTAWLDSAEPLPSRP
jgi:hypothetical protein